MSRRELRGVSVPKVRQKNVAMVEVLKDSSEEK